MTPELHQHLSGAARSLQLRLNHGRIDPVTAATEAFRLFTDAQDAARVRWLNLELRGYGDRVDSTPLNIVLGLPTGDRLVTHVAAYRTQSGRGARDAEFKHFFVEPLDELVRASARVASSGGTSDLELEFAPSMDALLHPRTGTFSRDIFTRIVVGFVAALHLQLGGLAK